MYAVSTIAGNLTADPELEYAGETPVLNFSVAVNDRRGNKDEVYFYTVRAWNKQAQAIHKYFVKGQAIALVCNIIQERWDDKKSGNKRSKEVHVVTQIMFTEPRQPRAAQTPKKVSTEPVTTHSLAQELDRIRYQDKPELKYSDDDLPF